MWRGRPRPRKAPTSTAVQSDHAILKPLSFRAQLYRLRFSFIKRSTGRRLILISVLGIGWYTPLPLIYAFHRFSLHVRSQIFEFTALTRKILSAWDLRFSKSCVT